jgi:hypothetical protein
MIGEAKQLQGANGDLWLNWTRNLIASSKANAMIINR